MSYFKSISNLLFSGKVNLAEKEIKDIIQETLNEGSLADVSSFLHQSKRDILKGFGDSSYFRAYLDSNAKGNSEYALFMFTMYVSEEVGVNPKLFSSWKLNKEFIEWFNQNIATGLNLQPVPPAQSSWTNFDPEGLGAEYQDTIGGVGKRSNGVTSGHREDEYGKVGDADSVGNVSPDAADAISKASDATDVRNRDIGSDKSLTKNVDADGATKALWAQNVGRTADDREAEQDMIAKQHKKDVLQGRNGQNTHGYNDRSHTGTRSAKYSRKTNSPDQKEQVKRFNAARLDPNVPEFAKRSQPNFDDWEKQNGKYQG